MPRIRTIIAVGTLLAGIVLGALSGTPSATAAVHPAVPSRLLDTRNGIGGPAGMVRPGDVVRVTAPAVAAGATSLTLNVTATDALAPGFATVWACDEVKPATSNLNFVPGRAVPNMAIIRSSVAPDGRGQFCLETSAPVHLLVDLMGWFSGSGDVVSSPPNRIVDTRQTGNPLQQGEFRRVRVAGTPGLPADASSALLNVTLTGTRKAGFLSVVPCPPSSGSVPGTSTMNFASGDTVAAFTVTALVGGEVCVFSDSAADLIVDTFGWVPSGGGLRLKGPERVLDTRNGVWSTGPAISGGEVRVRVAGRGGIPNTAVAALMTVTVSDTASSGYVTAWPCDAPKPDTSVLNFWPGSARANSVLVGMSVTDGEICLSAFTNNGSNVSLIADAVGWVPGSVSRSPVPAPPSMNSYAIPAPGGVSAGSILTRNQSFPPHASGDGSGNFRIVCGYSHMAYDDPIVAPGMPGASHLHTFFGNTGANAFSTYESLRNSGNGTCDGGTANRSSYWVPSLINGDQPVVPSEMFVYYKSGYRSVEPGDINPIPNGLRMIAGNARSATSQSQEIVNWSCESGGSTNEIGTIPDCRAGGQLRLSIYFPQCWNGRDLDSADHKSHMAYPTYGRGCPASHPVGLPVITVNILWDVPAGGTSNMFVVSDPMVNAAPGASAHADFFEAWDPTIRDTFTKNCIQAGIDCEVRLLGNGKELTYLG